MSDTSNTLDAFAVYQTHRIAIWVGILVVAATVSFLAQRDRRLDKMPGPGGYPLIGIGISLPPRAPSRFREWGNKFPDVFKLRVGFYNWVVINSPEAFREIMDKQSQITSSKMPAPIGDDIVSNGKRMFTLPYGPKWRVYRSITHQLVSSTMTATFIPTQEYETKQLMYDLATNNAGQREFYRHMRRFAFSIIMTSTYGMRIDSYDNEDIKHADESSRIIGKITRAGTFVVDEIPLLARLPKWLQPGRKLAAFYGATLLEAKMRLWRRLEKQVAEGKAPTCYVKEMMDNRAAWEKQGLIDADAAWITGGLVEVGSHTSTTTMVNLTLFLAANPEAQDKAHEELMRVVGPHRTPTYEDIENLPYIRSCLKEVLRLCPTPIFGIKHYSDADVVYKNYVIPKGTVLLANTSFMHYDGSRYEDPYAFKPERYLSYPKYSAEYAAGSDPYKRDHFSFGGGRRICPGTRLAENTLNISLANMLWAFKICPPIIDGVEAKMDTSDDAFENTHFRGAKPYACRFIPRSEDRIALIKSQWEQAKKEGYVLRGNEVDLKGVVIR